MKSKNKKNSKLLLSDKIADALTVKPRADIEDDQVFGTKPQTVSRADLNSSESEDDAAISDFRKRNVNLLSEISKKYEGQVVRRQNIDEETSESEVETESDPGSIGGFDSKLASITSKFTKSDSENSETELKNNITESVISSSDAESEDYSIVKRQHESNDEQSEEDSADDEGQGYDISQMEEPVQEEFEHMKKQNVSEDAKKGTCVRNQLLVWEGLLEMRIHLQRCVNTANQMPFPDTHKDLAQNVEFQEATSAAAANVTNVLDKLLALQNLLLKGFPETRTMITNKVSGETTGENKEESDEEIPSDTDNEEIPSDTEDEDASPKNETKSPQKTVSKERPQRKRKLSDYGRELETMHKIFKPFRDTTIQKWNEKTRLANATSIKNTPANTILQQISYILSDKSKLVKRTQLKRSEYDIIGYTKPASADNCNQSNSVENPVTRDRKDDDEYISEIFDDSDFYHQLLRELIECKSADISDPVQLSRQWIALQQMRSKMKRKVDTKATKGRKIKYVVHNQLVNYMAPEKCTSWTDESTNELCSSLFGKMFENNNVGFNANIENGLKIKH